MTIRLGRIVRMRGRISDQALLDFLDVAHLTRMAPGQLSTRELRERWACSQSYVSRRLRAVAAAGLVDITPGWGTYKVHSVSSLEEVA